MTAVANRAGLYSEAPRVADASRRAARSAGRADARRPAVPGIGPAAGLGLALAGCGLAAGMAAASSLGLALLPACLPFGLFLRQRVLRDGGTPDAARDSGHSAAATEGHDEEPRDAAAAPRNGAVTRADPAEVEPGRAYVATGIASCDAADAASFAVRLLQADADRAGVRVLCEIADAAPLAAFGQRDCRSAMLSVLGNALRISRPGDVVRVGLRGVRGALLLRVGGPARQDPREAEAALASARARIEAAGGSLLVESRPGCGTLASIRLPIAAPARLPPAPRHPRSSPAGTT